MLYILIHKKGMGVESAGSGFLDDLDLFSDLIGKFWECTENST